MPEETRRAFVKKIGAASALAASSFLNWNPRALGANDKVVLGLIGGRNQGHNDALGAISQGAEFKTFCDIDQAILDKISPELEKAQGKAPGTTKEFQRVLDDKDIDGVLICVPVIGAAPRRPRPRVNHCNNARAIGPTGYGLLVIV